jgi:predicted MFS family arabinose efflux permease
MFTPGIQQVAQSFKTSEEAVIACQTGYVVMLGIGPLILAPLSETFGREQLYHVCFTLFTILQAPAALSPNVATLITVRAITGFFGSMLYPQNQPLNFTDKK